MRNALARRTTRALTVAWVAVVVVLGALLLALGHYPRAAAVVAIGVLVPAVVNFWFREILPPR